MENENGAVVKRDKKKLSVKARNVIISLSVIGSILIGLLIWLIVELVPMKGNPNQEYWIPTQELSMDASYVVNLEKSPEKDFVILNFTDVQYNDALDIGGKKKNPDETMRKAVEEVKPDLITFTGDNVWASPFTRHSVRHFIETADSFGIPWAPIYGNHDEDGNCDKAWFSDRLSEAKHCVFRNGPNNIGGQGNYIINVTENGKIVHSLFMLDSGNNRYYPDLDTTDYDFIGTEKQMWYAWAVDGLTQLNGGEKPRSSVFLHIALPEYQTAYNQYLLKDENGEFLKDENGNTILDTERYEADGGFGKNGERVCSAPVNSGFFQVLKSMGSTFDVIAGHDHVNNSSTVYEGIRLTYGMKTGDRCYWQEDGKMNGGTKLTVNSGGVMTTEHIYIQL